MEHWQTLDLLFVHIVSLRYCELETVKRGLAITRDRNFRRGPVCLRFMMQYFFLGHAKECGVTLLSVALVYLWLPSGFLKGRQNVQRLMEPVWWYYSSALYLPILQK